MTRCFEALGWGGGGVVVVVVVCVLPWQELGLFIRISSAYSFFGHSSRQIKNTPGAWVSIHYTLEERKDGFCVVVSPVLSRPVLSCFVPTSLVCVLVAASP